MHSTDFARVFDSQVARSAELLKSKGAEYATIEDVLHNFKAAAGLNGTSEAQALWGMLTKHIVSLSDMVKVEPTAYDLAVWDEKITDSINFLILLRAIVIDSHWATQVSEEPVEPSHPPIVNDKNKENDPA